MISIRACRSFGLFLLFLYSPLLWAYDAEASPVLVVQAGDAAIPAGQNSGTIPIYLLNTTDSVEAFELVIRASDSLAVEFTGMVDTTGTLISGWQFNIISTFPGGIHMIWLPNQFGQDIIPSIPPASQTRTLIKLPFILHNLNPSFSYTFDITIDTTLDDFGFSNPLGYLIGIKTDTTIDTACLRCMNWSGTECLDWMLVQEPPCDSTFIDTTKFSYLDTSKTWVFDGTINVVTCCVGTRGNVNGDASEHVDLSDLSAMISYLVAGGATPACRAEADLNGSGGVDLTDLSMLIGYLLAGGTLMSCG